MLCKPIVFLISNVAGARLLNVYLKCFVLAPVSLKPFHIEVQSALIVQKLQTGRESFFVGGMPDTRKHIEVGGKSIVYPL